MLQMFGVTGQSEAVYWLMLAEPRLGVADLCERLGLADTEVRAYLDELVELALLRESREHPGGLRVVRPEVGLETLLRRHEEQLAARRQELASVRAQAAELVAERLGPAARQSAESTLRLWGMDAVQAELEVLTQAMKAECLSIVPGGAQSPASIDHARPLDADALSRGVSLKTLLQDSARHDPATHGYARWLTDLGGEVRTAPLLPLRMLIFDRQVAVIPIDPSSTRRGALRTREPEIVSSLAAVFDHAWNAAVPLGAARTGVDSENGLTRLDRELLRLLSAGMTDQAAGSRLGISERTVRRQMAALMERLEASSRFEAGLKAAKRGWLLSASGNTPRRAAPQRCEANQGWCRSR